MDPRIVSLQTGAARASAAAARLAAQWSPLDPPQAELMRPDPVLQKLGHTGLTPRGASEDPSRRWLGQGMNRPVAGLAQAPDMLAIGKPTDSLSEQVTASVVDIYLSVSASIVLTPGEYPACNQDEDTDCDLYRVRMNLITGHATEVERVVAHSDGYGNVQPALSPGGRRLAYVRRSETVGYLEAMDFDTREVTQVASGYRNSTTKVNTKPQFPNWYDESTLLFHAGERGDCTLYRSQIDDPLDLHFGSAEALLGPKSGVSTTTSFADANTRWATGDGVSTTADSSREKRRVATFGPGPGSSGAEAPRVHGLTPKRSSATEIVAEEFDLGFNMEARPIESCHHPAWNPGGNRIMCTSQDPSETYNTPGDNLLRFLYTYTYNSADELWYDPQPPFTPLTPAELEAEFGSLFPESGDPHCEIYTYKFAEWCASDNYIVATLFCSAQRKHIDSDDPYNIITSRVMLIRRFPVRYTDITRIVEKSRGLRPGQTHGVYSTCARVEEAG